MPALTFNQAKEYPDKFLMAMLVSDQYPDGSSLADSNGLVFDGIATIAASAAAGTIVNVDVALPAKLDPDSRYEIVAYNPGAVAVTVRAQNRETLGGSARFPQVASFTVAAGATSAPQIVQGYLLGENPARLAVSNDAANGATAFSVAVRVRKV